MSNTILTHQKIAREAVAMLMEEDDLIPNINTGRSGEFNNQTDGYKAGASVTIGVPPVPVTYTGNVFSAQDVAEDKVTLTVDTQIGVGLTFTTKEKVLDISQYRQRFLQPAITSLRSQIRATLLQRMMLACPNAVGTSGTIPTTRKVYAQAAGVLDRFLAPGDDRTCLYTTDANINLQDTNAALFNPSAAISKGFKTGQVDQYAGLNFYVDQALPVLTAGAGTGYLVNGAAQSGATLAVDTGTGALKKGQLFTIAGVYAVHPILGVSNGQLRQFVVTADYAGGAGNVSIYPAITPTNPGVVVGTVSAAPADNAAITLFDAVSASAVQNLAFHKNAFTAAFVPLPIIASCEGYTATADNVSLRVMTGGDFTNDKENTRIDVLFGSAATRPDHIVRVTQ